MNKFLLLIIFFEFYALPIYGTLAGGRPNAFSEGNNAFAGVVNPANAVWIPDRFDVGGYWQYQKSSVNNKENNPLFTPGKIDLTYKTRNLLTADIAIHKQVKFPLGSKIVDSSFTLAAYTLPNYLKLRTKRPNPASGNTPILLLHKIDVVSTIFSFKLNPSHSLGIAIDYFFFSHIRNGFQTADNPLRSVAPGFVTNNGRDHSYGVGVTLGWRWNISKRLKFGAAWTNKSYCGQFKKYRGYEPHHANNYTPQSFGAGFSYAFTTKLQGRLEALWVNLGNLPGANDNILSNGKLNLNKRGSDNSPGPGLQDATYINIGLGYKVNEFLALGSGFSHRIRLKKNSNFLSHSYTIQTIYDLLSLGANIKYNKHDIYLVFSYGFKNMVRGFMPLPLGGGRFVGEKQTTSLSLSWGYLY